MRILKFVSLLIAAWCVMTITHELGHIIAGLCCGGQLQSFDLAPWRLPYSLFSPDPFPLVTVWSGPVLGVLLPSLVAWLVGRRWLWFIAHFCTLANGTYIAVAWVTGEPQLDTHKLLQHGAHPLSIALFCTVTIVVGYLGFRQACIGILRPHVPRLEA